MEGKFPIDTNIQHFSFEDKFDVSLQTMYLPGSKKLFVRVSENGTLGTVYVGGRSEETIFIQPRMGKRDGDDIERVIVRRLIGRLKLDQNVMVGVCLLKHEDVDWVVFVSSIVENVLKMLPEDLVLEKDIDAHRESEDDEFGPI